MNQKSPSQLEVRFIEFNCWKCGILNHIYYVVPDDNNDSHCSPENFDCTIGYQVTIAQTW